MGNCLTSIIAASLLGMANCATPAAAQEAGLGCLAGSYSKEQRETIKSLQGSQVDGSGETSARFSALALEAAQSCAQAHSWDRLPAMNAALYELGRLSETSYRLSGQLSANQLARIDETLAADDHSALWDVVERFAMANIKGEENDDPAGLLVMGAFAANVGMTNQAEAVNLGILLGYMALQRIGQREFISLQEG